MQLTKRRVIPVVVINNAKRADALGDALVAGGLPVAEVTFRTPAAAEAIRRLAANPRMLVGAGTVITPEQVDDAAEAGAQFVVSPGLNEDVVLRAKYHGLPVFPGAVTPTEIMTALSLGLTTVKFFPANLHGGPPSISALGAPFPQVRFIPTGGVTATNASEYLSLPNVVAVGGSWMVPSHAIDAGDFGRIVQLCRRAVEATAPFRVA